MYLLFCQLQQHGTTSTSTMLNLPKQSVSTIWPPEASEWSCSISAALARSCPWEDSTTCCKAVQLVWLLWSTIQVYDQYVTNVRITLLTSLLTKHWHIMWVISASEPKISCAWLILAAWSATLRSPRIKPLSSDLRCLPRAKVMAQ